MLLSSAAKCLSTAVSLDGLRHTRRSETAGEEDSPALAIKRARCGDCGMCELAGEDDRRHRASPDVDVPETEERRKGRC